MHKDEEKRFSIVAVKTNNPIIFLSREGAREAAAKISKQYPNYIYGVTEIIETVSPKPIEYIINEFNPL